MKSVRFSLGLILILSAQSLFGQKEIKYPFSSIPQELLTNSNAVFREDITTVEVVDLGKAKIYSKYAITILNEKADHYAEVALGYDKIHKITTLNACSFDKSGIPINTIKAKDIIDYSAYDGFSIYSDNRTKRFDLRYPNYPYTIEVEVAYDFNGFLTFPGWTPFSSFSVSSEKSSYQLISPSNYEIRYKEINMEPAAKVETVDGRKVISWNFGSFSALEREPRMPYFQEVIPRILAAPSTFTYEGYAGSISDWKSFGLFQLKLNEGRNQLTPEVTAKVKNMVNDQQTQAEKVATLYEYLQKNTRYVSIQLGIGGLQPFPASQVASTGYGDCKALSNYMKSMLDVLGVNSYYTIINGGEGEPDIYTDFPSAQFNHVILCVPNEQDTIWLECTSQKNPFGYQGQFTGDRDALVVNEKGGFIAHTTIYNQDNNRQDQYTNVVLNEAGFASVTFSSVCKGLQYENYEEVLEIGENEQKKWLYKRIDIPSFEITAFKFNHEKKPIPELNANVSANITRYGSASGKRLFFQPNVFNKINSIAIPQKERKYPLALRYPFIDTDTVSISIPQGYHLEFVPTPVSIESPYGRYTAQVIPSENGLLYIRTYSLVKGTFPPEQYMDFVKFINKVAEVDKSKLVLVKAT
jgi:hypothetical protein